MMWNVQFLTTFYSLCELTLVCDAELKMTAVVDCSSTSFSVWGTTFRSKIFVFWVI